MLVLYHNPEVVTEDISRSINIQKDPTVSCTFVKNGALIFTLFSTMLA